ncbi:MAG: folylpolyglutamate synthase/dihydrofolate synthase family protein [Chitinophagales bacterium]
MNYQQTLQYLYHQLPMFQRIGPQAFKKDLDNILALCQHLGQPQESFKSIHIAGTNGKGSTAHALSAILQQAGYKVGLYTSPHYRDFRERIKINGEYITEQAVVDFVAVHRAYFEDLKPSFFEMTVALAFDYFAEQSIDIAIVEVGLGGRLDSTNILSPILSVITNISFDHTDMLGDTLPLIAAEKAGIIKSNTPVVIGEIHPETRPVFEAKAKEMNAPIHFAEQTYLLNNVEKFLTYQQFDVYKNGALQYPNLQSDLQTNYQLKNMVTILQCVDFLPQLGFEVSEENVYSGLKEVKKISNLLGRWHILSEKNPIIIADSAHNIAGIQYAIQQIEAVDYQHLHFVFGTVNDKKPDQVLQQLPTDATYYFCKADVPRGLDAQKLQQKAAEFGLQGEAYVSVGEALKAAKLAADAKDLIYIGGSIFVVAEIV